MNRAKSLPSILAMGSLMAAMAPTIHAAVDAPPPGDTTANQARHERFDACRKEADEKKLTPDTGRRAFIRSCLKSERNNTQHSAPADAERG